MERNEDFTPTTIHNQCKHCGTIFLTLVDEQHDECPDCLEVENDTKN